MVQHRRRRPRRDPSEVLYALDTDLLYSGGWFGMFQFLSITTLGAIALVFSLKLFFETITPHSWKTPSPNQPAINADFRSPLFLGKPKLKPAVALGNNSAAGTK
eukprot:CAMPEP_0202815852 /NCGR_PEP_ID=MMETSP1389-20130828/6537_1 /ASSEMBLY_ACC=CAM_ASM_000865 /TAXON_ID=302021 /ORGANISM="Rhodomonas sp., Strain CCMP768" /LENGTH=103 /DNA_ID=CAMNT_0049487821 /DNA_START=86 /DNA_END=397 /DNA_ORIENTATION=+